jgi:excinuclease ABC subunit A
MERRDDLGGGTQAIVVRGARVHNLRGVDVDLPHGRFVALTGVSGSGKSTLAFDTIHAESRRRYLESLGPAARGRFEAIEPPDADLIDGLSPTVAVDAAAGAPSPRSTVGTLTECLDYLRILYARAGVPHCPRCDRPIAAEELATILDDVLARPEGTKVVVLAPLLRPGDEPAGALAAVRKAGLLRARIDGEMVEVESPPSWTAGAKAVDAVVDRLVIRPGIRPRLAESLELALRLGDGIALLSTPGADGTWTDEVRSTQHACPACRIAVSRREPSGFSFNTPQGACADCNGLGRRVRFDPRLALGLEADRPVPEVDPTKLPVRAALRAAQARELDELIARRSGAPARPKGKRKAKAVATLAGMALWADGDDGPGLEGLLSRWSSEARSERAAAALAALRVLEPCPSCRGARLNADARGVRLGGMGLHELSAMGLDAATEFLCALPFPPALAEIGPALLREVVLRLEFLRRVGLGYLSLDRAADTLSGGERQRVRLAARMGAGLTGVTYVLDEPTAGLHPADSARLVACLTDLRDAGNTVLVVEHDLDVIRAADWVVDLGPGAGPDGGRVVAVGPPATLTGADSLTSHYLHRTASPPPLTSTAPAGDRGWVAIRGARVHNLAGDEARFPVGTLTCVTGVSGSGKSTLVLDVLVPALRRALSERVAADGEGVAGLGAFDRLLVIDQGPIGRGVRSTPATYTGAFDALRRLYARTKEARVRGFGPGRFSYNARGGRCETCLGQGVRRLDPKLLPDVTVPCEACGGSRFAPAVLEVRFRGLSIADALALRVDEAVRLFAAVPDVARPLSALHEAGLGYVSLGQSSPTLSGGEAQRVKLAAELADAVPGRALTVLDEPTTGLHPADVARLLATLRGLVAKGHTLVVIEHHLDLIRAADWVVDLGPGAGPDGGRVVAMGTPAEVAACGGSRTGTALRGGRPG